MQITFNWVLTLLTKLWPTATNLFKPHTPAPPYLLLGVRQLYSNSTCQPLPTSCLEWDNSSIQTTHASPSLPLAWSETTPLFKQHTPAPPYLLLRVRQLLYSNNTCQPLPTSCLERDNSSIQTTHASPSLPLACSETTPLFKQHMPAPPYLLLGVRQLLYSNNTCQPLPTSCLERDNSSICWWRSCISSSMRFLALMAALEANSASSSWNTHHTWDYMGTMTH